MSARWRKGRNERDQLRNPPPLPMPHLLALFSIPPREAQQLRPTSPGPFTAAPSDVSVELTLGLNPSCSETERITALFQETLEAKRGGGNEPREGSSWWAAPQELDPVFSQVQEAQPSSPTGEPSPQRPTLPLLPLFPPREVQPPSPTLGPRPSLPVPSEWDVSLGLKPCGSEMPSHAEPETLFIKVHRMVSKQGGRHGNDKKGAP
ncbi:hypothetical protein V6N13_020325 [Hibiscus sabdariffa]